MNCSIRRDCFNVKTYCLEKKRRLVRRISDDDDSGDEFVPPVKPEEEEDDEYEKLFGKFEDVIEDELMVEAVENYSIKAPKKGAVTPLMEKFQQVSVAPSSSRYGKPSVSAFARMNMTSKSEKRQDRNQKFKEKNDDRYHWLQNIEDSQRNPIGSAEYDPRTLYIPPIAWSKFTPFEKQYWEVKHKHWDTVSRIYLMIITALDNDTAC